MIFYSLPQSIRLDHATCPTEGVYLRWLSPLGNWEGWHLTGDTDDATAIEDATSYRPGSGRRTVAIRRPGVTTQLVRAGNLTDAEHAALSTMLDSPQVYRQYPGGRLESVFVRSAQAGGRTTGSTRHTFEVEVETGRRNTITR